MNDTKFVILIMFAMAALVVVATVIIEFHESPKSPAPHEIPIDDEMTWELAHTIDAGMCGLTITYIDESNIGIRDECDGSIRVISKEQSFILYFFDYSDAELKVHDVEYKIVESSDVWIKIKRVSPLTL